MRPQAATARLTTLRSRTLRTVTPFIAAAVAVAVGLGGCTATSNHIRRAGDGVSSSATSDVASPAGLGLTITQGNCGGPWRSSGGIETFQILNQDIQTTEVDLIDPATGGVYAEVESLAPHVTRPMRVRLGRGSYAFRCYPEDNDAVTGPIVRVAAGIGTPAVRPVSSMDLAGAVTTYDSYVAGGVAILNRDVATLAETVRTGTRAEAEAAWLVAHLDYNRLGAAYGAFGDFADEIDGSPDGLSGGVRDPRFIGFHRIEYGLWHGEPLPVIATVTDRLVHDVAALQAALPHEQIDPNDLPLRAHEIMESAVQFQLTGEADQGSGTSLATALANVDGTQQVLTAIEPVLKPRYAGWSSLGPWLTRTRQALAAAQRADHTWTPVGCLSTADREHIDAAAGGLLEALAPLATIGDVRRSQ